LKEPQLSAFTSITIRDKPSVNRPQHQRPLSHRGIHQPWTLANVEYRPLLKSTLWECRQIHNGAWTNYSIGHLDLREGITLTGLAFHSFSGWLNDEVIRFGMGLFELEKHQSIPFLLTLSSYFIPTAITAYNTNNKQYDPTAVSRWTKLYKIPRSPLLGKHLQYGSIITTIVHVPGHWFAVAIIHGTLHLFNGFNEESPDVVAVFQGWWKSEHEQCEMLCIPLTVEYHRNYGTETGYDIQQDDSVSCGISALMHLYYIIVMNKIAHAEDFSFDHIVELRLFLAMKFLLYGKSHPEFFKKSQADLSIATGRLLAEKKALKVRRDNARVHERDGSHYYDELDDFFDRDEGDVMYLKTVYAIKDEEVAPRPSSRPREDYSQDFEEYLRDP